MAGVGVVDGSGWLIGGACLALVSLVVGDGYLTEDGCLAIEALGGKYDFLIVLVYDEDAFVLVKVGA